MLPPPPSSIRLRRGYHEQLFTYVTTYLPTYLSSSRVPTPSTYVNNHGFLTVDALFQIEIKFETNDEYGSLFPVEERTNDSSRPIIYHRRVLFPSIIDCASRLSLTVLHSASSAKLI